MRLILVDDEEQMRSAVRRLIERRTTFEIVGEAADGYQAVDLVVRLSPDVVVMDIKMPGLNGIAATKQIRLLRPRTCVIALSDSDDSRARDLMRAAGAVGYIDKSHLGDLLYVLQQPLPATPYGNPR